MGIKDFVKAKTYIALNTRAGSADECAMCDLLDHFPSNDHSNGDRNYAPHNHKDGGYALRHRWL